MDDPVREFLEHLGEWWKINEGWKRLGITLLIILFTILVLVFALSWLIRSISIGGFRNKDLYFPRFGNEDLYFPRRKK